VGTLSGRSGIEPLLGRDGIIKDNARPEAGAVYGAMDMPWAKLAAAPVHAVQRVFTRRPVLLSGKLP
jgi:hypothetical protein